MLRLLLICAFSLCLLVTSCDPGSQRPPVPPTVEASVPPETPQAIEQPGEEPKISPSPEARAVPTESDIPAQGDSSLPDEAAWGELHF